MCDEITRALAVSSLIIQCEAIAASGKLDEVREFALRHNVAKVKAAYGIRQIGDHAPDYNATLSRVAKEIEHE